MFNEKGLCTAPPAITSKCTTSSDSCNKFTLRVFGNVYSTHCFSCKWWIQGDSYAPPTILKNQYIDELVTIIEEERKYHEECQGNL